MNCFIRPLVGLTVALVASAGLAAEPATAPTAAPATAKASVTPEAAAVLEKISSAYANLKSLDLSGNLSGEFDVAGQKENHKADFTTSFAAPNKFKHEVKDEALMGSTGDKLYIYTKDRNLYLTADAPKDKVMSDELPEPFSQLIGAQNLSLTLAMSKDPTAELKKSYQKIDKSADVKVGETSYTALALSNAVGTPSTTLLIDPQTNLVRRATIDMSGDLVSRGAPDVKKATVTIDYTSSKSGAAPKADQFAWALPLGVAGLPALLACFTALGFGVAHLFWCQGSARLLALGVGLGGSEWLRGVLFTGFPWNDIGMSLGGNLVTAQVGNSIEQWHSLSSQFYVRYRLLRSWPAPLPSCASGAG